MSAPDELTQCAIVVKCGSVSPQSAMNVTCSSQARAAGRLLGYRASTWRALGGIILGIDGLPPEKGHETLYALRDAIPHTNLLTRSLANRSATHLVALIEEVKTIGIPILGMVTDQQHYLVPAVDWALPDTPHQLCPFHFFRNLAQPVADADCAMKKRIKKAPTTTCTPPSGIVISTTRSPEFEQRAVRAFYAHANNDVLKPFGRSGCSLWRTGHEFRAAPAWLDRVAIRLDDRVDSLRLQDVD